MAKLFARASTGLDGLDNIIDGLRTGDNVVWQVDNVEDYSFFVNSFVQRALAERKRVVYMRFAEHRPLLSEDMGIVVYTLDAHVGFESFSTQIYTIATQEGEDVYYIFDSLSDLLSAWATDLMIGNFFRITCPYLFQLNTIAYFALMRNSHSFKTVARIRETTQLFLDICDAEGKVYVHPLKVQRRHSPTMFLPHLKKGDRFIPVTSSFDASRLLAYISLQDREHTKRKLDYWDRLFLSVEELITENGEATEKGRLLELLCQIMIAKEKRVLDLALEYLTLEDLMEVKNRLIGTGYIGGKAAGMVIARKILERDGSFPWQRYLEPHDSFFVGSDVFYSYLVENGWWKLRMQQRTREGYFEVAKVLRDQMVEGSFPDEIEEQFMRVIEYYGQSPIIVRSSSLLEDAFGNAFAGKYESIFCVNQGTPEQRYRQFGEIVRTVFASVMNEDALAYRLQRGLDQQDEQMALLVQRVSGSYRNRYFFPDLAGVGISYNTFVWKKGMDSHAGMLRMVLGLGTRAVNRVENDYPRLVALDSPLVKPHAGLGDARRYSQHEVDVLNIDENTLETLPLSQILVEEMKVKTDLLAVRDTEASDEMRDRGKGDKDIWILTLDRFLSETSFPAVMQRMLKQLQETYHYPVDIEFTVNLTGEEGYRVNLVQCRPLQTKGEGQRVRIPTRVDEERILFRSKGNFMGSTMAQPLKRIIYIVPEAYAALAVRDKYDIARLVGKHHRQIGDMEAMPALLMGPGRWGTTTPSLGIPVRFAEINNIAVIVEIAALTGSLMPDLSFGTHFFMDLVETDIFYIAIFPEREGVFLNSGLLQGTENRLRSILPDSAHYEDVVRVIDLEGENLYLMADIVSQRVLCFKASKIDQ